MQLPLIRLHAPEKLPLLLCWEPQMLLPAEQALRHPAQLQSAPVLVPGPCPVAGQVAPQQNHCRAARAAALMVPPWLLLRRHLVLLRLH